ncbi:hypothetical protein CO057_02510 [Candidatus Uhrbacteria bacterium CG_4_9_14_0_2_um_filter_41_50]|uniref:Colicin V production protein n=1 Tax=Candidatus Uhrbacteria bacterium CG_4_9_14_0_2_um_filter_41_50 TaxID=1975031 RepID=A0A2M8EP42_9BACT|nr:MAG: hypothetical protein COZ45_04365 [Candidatus Uhrbacteria bacterium CG_4_10_14_3_um_filter_41_21]PIZ55075.1 MAG: hypothetical protein COY24_01785 [Candidatus Uhrbacteria bacterium CG_4_10_14_0_2_um_filter_41_21]PJB85007.1 MAG: hypothetical protein CO086_00655 [Candidatus Uhrbacteria bacterium CG_4_9_14_0_8_um_filter_41_16]PJC24514.1 MAG: hypothetical protein CO057_02510 [Candidatus Uhrbacteria bacterium CG_4_9_14_0_2_um_filter_41_50]PJE74740.1 MAG: hypothetical protein COV03_03980 [Candi
MFTLADIFLIAIVLFFILVGLHQGFIRSLGSLVGMIGGIAAGSFGLAWFSQNVSDLSESPVWTITIFIIIMLICSQLIGLAFELLDRIFKILSIIPFLKSINKLLGGILGLIEAVIILSSVLYFVQNYISDQGIIDAVNTSFVMGWLGWAQLVISWLFPLIINQA